MRIYTNGIAGTLADNPINFDATPPLIGCDINFGMMLYPLHGTIDDARRCRGARAGAVGSS